MVRSGVIFGCKISLFCQIQNLVLLCHCNYSDSDNSLSYWEDFNKCLKLESKFQECDRKLLGLGLNTVEDGKVCCALFLRSNCKILGSTYAML